MTMGTMSRPDLPAASGLTGQTTELPTPGEYPKLDVETQVPIIIGVTSAFLALSTLMVVARLYTRYGVIKVAGDDDITIGVAQVGTDRSAAVACPRGQTPTLVLTRFDFADHQHRPSYHDDTAYVHSS